MTLSPDLTALKAEAAARTCASWADERGWKLRRAGAELVGPCPVCGGDDRFAIHTAKNVWQCRKCGVGGDVIFLVRHTENCGFIEACEKLAGRAASSPVDPERAARLRKQAERDAARREVDEQRRRAEAQRDAEAKWELGRPCGDLVAAYFRARGLAGAELEIDRRVLREHPGLYYWAGRGVRHTGPVMLARVDDPDGEFSGLHATFLAESLVAVQGRTTGMGRAGGLPAEVGTGSAVRQPDHQKTSRKGKAIIADAAGNVVESKITRGSVRAGAIRLKTPPRATRLVIGEGIETTLSVMMAEKRADTAYWAAANLGNLAGRAARDSSGTLHRAEPDLSDTNCFTCPEWVTELVLLGDGDSERGFTRDALTRGAKRALRLRGHGAGPEKVGTGFSVRDRDHQKLRPLNVRLAWAGDGVDFNDLKMANPDSAEAASCAS